MSSSAVDRGGPSNLNVTGASLCTISLSHTSHRNSILPLAKEKDSDCTDSDVSASIFERPLASSTKARRATHRRSVAAGNRLTRWIDNKLVGNSDSADYNEAWREKFSRNPSWCDADMALQQINAGKATGNKVSLYVRTFFQQALYQIGVFIQKHPVSFLWASFIFMLVCCYGLRYVVIETDIVKLWVSQDGRLNEELNFLSEAHKLYAEEQRRHKRAAGPAPVNATVFKKTPPPSSGGPELPRENGLGGGFQVVIQTPQFEGENVLSKEGLLRHVKLMEEISKYQVDMFGANWTLADICFKPPAPTLPQGTLNQAIGVLLERIIPCIWITPIDCFWEGAKPLGPHPPLLLGDEVSAFVASIPKGNITWKNLNPSAVINEVATLLDLGTIRNFFQRAGIGSAYLDRPCIDPLDFECPKDAPNYFDRCAALEKFTTWNNALDANERITLAEEVIAVSAQNNEVNLIGDLLGRKKRAAENGTEEDDLFGQIPTRPASSTSTTTTTVKPAGKKGGKDDDEYYNYDDADYGRPNISVQAEDPKAINCRKYGRDLMRWMNENPKKWSAFLTPAEMPKYPDYGKLMTGGCKGFGKNIMKWPEDLIIGGITRGKDNVITKAEAFQSVFLVAGPRDVYLRFKGAKPDVKPTFDNSTWSQSKANAIIHAWQRNFTRRIYDHYLNKPEENMRVVHPLASTSIADMLEEFSEFKFFVIFMGYVLMVIYAGWTQLDFKGWWFSVKSATFISIVGVLMTTYSSIAGLGLAAFMNINFNAATTQIVPFLTLGLGIDDMFLLLHNYHELFDCVRRNEMGVLLKETGMSVLITSTNNILAFLAGIILPIPALRSFCAQTAILLVFNLITNMGLFPAVIALDLKRRRAGRRDMTMACCCDPEKIVPTESTANVIHNSTAVDHGPKVYPWWSLEGFLINIYIPALKIRFVKFSVIMSCVGMFIFGIYGLYYSKLGLELADVLPEHTAPAAFLRAREKYFSFYPMFAVLKGPHIDYPNQQAKIEELRHTIAKSDFVIKLDGKPSEPYWMSLMRLWLNSLQTELDKSIAAGVVDPVNGSLFIRSTTDERINDEALLARRLICSYGNKYNCTGRIGMVKLVDEFDIINPEGFYNYMTAWFHVDNMMYYVSQAAFFPNPPAWRFDPWEDSLIPPASPLYYSQIPFYLTGLTDTPPIVKMIREVRAISENFTAEGLPNYPTGLAFTFWEQYLHLYVNLTTAIFIIGGSVLFVISIILFNPWAASMVAVCVVSMTIELAGFMGAFGIKMNPISAVTLITAVGIGVEFTAHVVLAFLTAMGTRDDRMQAALEHMFIPVLHGGISTLLGIVMLAFSEFDFVVKYFFVVMSTLLMVGLFNGLTLLPVMLSLFGPSCEITPTDGSDRLPAPPPLNKQLKKRLVVQDALTLAEHGLTKDGKIAKKDLAKTDSESSSSPTPTSSESDSDQNDVETPRMSRVTSRNFRTTLSDTPLANSTRLAQRRTPRKVTDV